MSLNRFLFRLIQVSVALVVLLVAFRFYGYFALRKSVERFRAQAGTLNPADMAPPDVGEIVNAGTVLQGGAYSLLVTTQERTMLRELTQKSNAQWTDADVSRVRPVLERNEAAYQVLTLSIPLEESSFGLKYDMGWDMQIPNYLRFIEARGALGARVRMKMMENDLSEALKTMAVQERMAAALMHERVLISLLVGQAIQRDYDSLVLEMLPVCDVNMLKTLDKQLQHLRENAAPPNKVFAAEAVAMYTKFRDEYPEDENREFLDDLLARILYKSNRRLFLSNMLDIFSDFLPTTGTPMAKQVPVHGSSRWSTRQIVKSLLSDVNYGSALGRIQSVNAEAVLAHLAVKITLHARSSGRYPQNLSSFSPPECPYTGERVTYKLEPDGSAALSFPEADRLWEQSPRDPTVRKPMFVWRLPRVQP